MRACLPSLAILRFFNYRFRNLESVFANFLSNYQRQTPINSEDFLSTVSNLQSSPHQRSRNLSLSLLTHQTPSSTQSFLYTVFIPETSIPKKSQYIFPELILLPKMTPVPTTSNNSPRPGTISVRIHDGSVSLLPLDIGYLMPLRDKLSPLMEFTSAVAEKDTAIPVVIRDAVLDTSTNKLIIYDANFVLVLRKGVVRASKFFHV